MLFNCKQTRDWAIAHGSIDFFNFSARLVEIKLDREVRRCYGSWPSSPKPSSLRHPAPNDWKLPIGLGGEGWMVILLEAGWVGGTGWPGNGSQQLGCHLAEPERGCRLDGWNATDSRRKWRHGDGDDLFIVSSLDGSHHFSSMDTYKVFAKK